MPYIRSTTWRWKMARRVDLIDQFTELVVGAGDPRRLAERTLEAVMPLLNGRAGAVFTSTDDGVTLFASRGIDQAVLDIVPVAWTAQKDGFRRGETFYVPDRATARRRPPPVAGGRPTRGRPTSSAPRSRTWSGRSCSCC